MAVAEAATVGGIAEPLLLNLLPQRQAANNVPPVPAPAGGAPPAAPAAPAPPAKPRLFVYALNAPGAQR